MVQMTASRQGRRRSASATASRKMVIGQALAML
jgi:hypothetical protein